MALKVELKPHERMIIGQSVITNGKARTTLSVEGHTPILREKDILHPEQATTPAKRIYLCVQMMYLAENPQIHHSDYFKLVNDVITAAPSTFTIIEEINNHILTNNLYKALKQAQTLVTYEEELIEHATSRD